MTSSVKWESQLSSPFVIRQGVRQGGVLSTSHYMRYNNPLLIQLEDKYTGMVVGSIQIPHITVADDLALVSDSKDEMQYMLEDSGGFANQEHYVIHPTKSGMLVYGNGSHHHHHHIRFRARFPLPRVGLFDKSSSKTSSPLRAILRVSRVHI